MKQIMIALLLLGGAAACNGQGEKNKQAELKTEETKPQAGWKVNKEYDRDGNLVRYDSTYVQAYSSVNGVPQQVDIDSLLNAFRGHVGMGFSSFFNDMPGTAEDSTFFRGFGMPGGLMGTWQQQEWQMGMMMRRMDSLRNNFFKNGYPAIDNRRREGELRTKTL